MDQFAITAEQLAAIEKSAKSIVGDDAEKVALLVKSFTQLRDTLVVDETIGKDANGDDPDCTDDEPDDKADPVKKVLMDLYGAVAAVSKNAPKAQAAFEKAFADLSVLSDGIEKAFAAGAEAAIKKGVGNIDDNETDMEKIMKSLPAAARKVIEDITKSNKDLTAKVEKLQGERDAQHFAKVAAEIGQPAEYGETLRKMHAASPEVYETVVKDLRAKNEQIKKSGLFKEIGGGGAQTGTTAIEKLNGHATEIQKAAGGKLTKAKAFVQACQDNPELYRQYKDEARG